MAACDVARSGQPKPGWYVDPTGRHDARRWDGDVWSEWVIDGGRRSFDDIDGCGGPPQGALVQIDGSPMARRLVGRASRGGGRSVGRGGGAGSPSDALLPSTDAASPVVPLAIAVAVIAGAAALAMVVFAERTAVAAVGAVPMATVVERYQLQFVAAIVVFESIVLVGSLALTRRARAGGPVWPALRRAGRDAALRGLVAFLLALFARTFVLSLVAGPFGIGIRPVGTWWVFVVEAAVVLVVAPVAEERVFRGVLLRGLRRRSGPVVAVLGQAAIYGAALSWTGGTRIAAVLGMMAVGAVFGWFVHVTDDLRPALVGHVFLNSWFLVERLLAG